MGFVRHCRFLSQSFCINQRFYGKLFLRSQKQCTIRLFIKTLRTTVKAAKLEQTCQLQRVKTTVRQTYDCGRAVILAVIGQFFFQSVYLKHYPCYELIVC